MTIRPIRVINAHPLCFQNSPNDEARSIMPSAVTPIAAPAGVGVETLHGAERRIPMRRAAIAIVWSGIAAVLAGCETPMLSSGIEVPAQFAADRANEPAPARCWWTSSPAAGPGRARWRGRTRRLSVDWVEAMVRMTPRERTLFGFPAPGDPYWDEQTDVGLRYPDMDMAPSR
jgi:hypothetical protein